MRSMLLLFLIACGTTSPPNPTPPEKAVREPADESPEQGDGHAARHGGIQKELEGMHVEGLFEKDGVRFYLADADNQPLPPTAVTGRATILGPAGAETRELTISGDSLLASASLEVGKPASVVLTITREGKTQSASFESNGVGSAFHDHTALHGGTVGMWGHYHVELLATEGTYRAWVTNASRGVLTSGVSGAVVEGEQRLPLSLDPQTGALTVASANAGRHDIQIEITHDGQKFSMPFKASTPTGDSHAQHAH